MSYVKYLLLFVTSDRVDYKYVDLSQDGATALHVASQEGHNQVVELLLQAGASVDQKAKVRWGISYSAFMNSRDNKPCLYPLIVSKS